MPALATSSTGHPVAPESHWSVSAFPAPRAISTSPSGWKRTSPPMGATATGQVSGTPRRLVRRSIARTSTRTFCWMARRSRWRRLRRSVRSVSAPPSPKFHASRGSRCLAARRISGRVTKRGPESSVMMSAPPELRAALLGERLHALLVVLTVEAVGDQLVEQGEVAVARGLHELLHGRLGGAQGERRVARDRQRVGAREALELTAGHDLVHEPHAQRVLGAEIGAGREEDLIRVGRPDQLHQLFHAVVVVAEAEPRRRNAEAGVVRREADVAGDRDADAPAHAVPVDHGEEGLRQRGERVLPASGDPAVLLLVGHVAAAVLELRDIGAGDERLIAGAAQDDHADGVVGGEVVYVVGHQLPHLLAHRVPLLRLVEDDPADRSVLLDQQLRRLGHRVLPFTAACLRLLPAVPPVEAHPLDVPRQELVVAAPWLVLRKLDVLHRLIGALASVRRY